MSLFDTPRIPDASPAPATLEGPPNADERTFAMLAELLQLFSWFIGPLIIFFVKRDSRFVRFHAIQAVLWQVCAMVLFMLCAALLIPTLILTSKPGGTLSPSSVIFIFGFYGIIGLVWLANFIIAIHFAVKANAGSWARYPILWRLARTIIGAS